MDDSDDDVKVRCRRQGELLLDRDEKEQDDLSHSLLLLPLLSINDGGGECRR
jgi:hypothetical protein